MREAYYQEDSIRDLSSRWLDRYGNPRKEERQPLKVNSAALLVLDMQEYFLCDKSHAYIPSGPAIIPNLNRVIRFFRLAGRPVLATRHLNSKADAAMMGSWWSELITRDHPLSGLHPGLDIEEGEILDKAQYDAFYQSDLEARLAKFKVTQLVIGGVMAHLCCETTTRAAFVRGFEVFFLVDGTATYSADLHTASLRTLAHGFAVLTTTERLLEKDQ